jgi:hypothetical protein
METQGIFPDFGVQDETSYHALVTCTFANMFWQNFNELYNIKLPKLHPATWCFDLLDNSVYPATYQCPILCGMWVIWTMHNGRHHGEIKNEFPASW